MPIRASRLRRASSGYCPQTTNTTRLCAGDIRRMAALTSQLVYVSPLVRPAAVVLVPDFAGEIAFAAASLVQGPSAGPLLFYSRDGLPPETAREIRRLRPSGEGVPAPVLVAGGGSRSLFRSLEYLGYGYLPIGGRDPTETAAELAFSRAALIPPDGRRFRDALVLSLGNWSDAAGAPALAAATGSPILFCGQNSVPPATRVAVEGLGYPNLHVVSDGLGPEMRRELEDLTKKNLSFIIRRPGESTTLAMVRYQCPKTLFGWGTAIVQPRAVCLIPAGRWEYAVAAAIVACRGKHAPVIEIDDERLSPELAAWLEENRNLDHAYLLGGTDELDLVLQHQVDIVLERDGQRYQSR